MSYFYNEVSVSCGISFSWETHTHTDTHSNCFDVLLQLSGVASVHRRKRWMKDTDGYAQMSEWGFQGFWSWPDWSEWSYFLSLLLEGGMGDTKRHLSRYKSCNIILSSTIQTHIVYTAGLLLRYGWPLTEQVTYNKGVYQLNDFFLFSCSSSFWVVPGLWSCPSPLHTPPVKTSNVMFNTISVWRKISMKRAFTHVFQGLLKLKDYS